MAVYRFRVIYEENEDVFRDIEIKSIQTFEDFHKAIQQAYNFDNKHAASFFVSDDYWRKNREITLRKEDLPLEPDEIKKGVEAKKLMSETKIAKFIEQPHQKFIYIFDQNVQWCFLIEMLKIADENPKQVYPVCVRTVGTAPKQYKQMNLVKEEEDPLLAALGLGKKEQEPNDEEIFKSISNEVHGVEEEDLESLEGEEGDESEEESEGEDEFNEDGEDSGAEFGQGEDEDRY